MLRVRRSRKCGPRSGHLLRRGGALSRTDLRYVERETQLTLALAVADAIESRSPLVAEAGTGIGKTFAYLVPALLSGARVLVSTATKSLQDQLFLRDLPKLREALQVPVSVALLKGRASYLCLHRLASRARGRASAGSMGRAHTGARSNSGRRPRSAATWPRSMGSTNGRRSFRSSRRRARTAWARSVRSTGSATS